MRGAAALFATALATAALFATALATAAVFAAAFAAMGALVAFAPASVRVALSIVARNGVTFFAATPGASVRVLTLAPPRREPSASRSRATTPAACLHTTRLSPRGSARRPPMPRGSRRDARHAAVPHYSRLTRNASRDCECARRPCRRSFVESIVVAEVKREVAGSIQIVSSRFPDRFGRRFRRPRLVARNRCRHRNARKSPS